MFQTVVPHCTEESLHSALVNRGMTEKMRVVGGVCGDEWKSRINLGNITKYNLDIVTFCGYLAP